MVQWLLFEHSFLMLLLNHEYSVVNNCAIIYTIKAVMFVQTLGTISGVITPWQWATSTVSSMNARNRDPAPSRRQAGSLSAAKINSSPFWNRKVHYSFHTTQSLVTVLTLMYPLYSVIPCVCYDFNITHPSAELLTSPCLVLFSGASTNIVRISTFCLPHVSHLSRQCHFLVLQYYNTIGEV
jgi:hypothetical protein